MALSNTPKNMNTINTSKSNELNDSNEKKTVVLNKNTSSIDNKSNNVKINKDTNKEDRHKEEKKIEKNTNKDVKNAEINEADDIKFQDVTQYTKKTATELYHRLSDIDHILLRPANYIGNVTNETSVLWILEKKPYKYLKKSITYNPGLLKIFDEIIANAIDNRRKYGDTTTIEVDIDRKTGKYR